MIPSLQDFSLIKTYVDRLMQERGFSQPSLAFTFFALDLILDLQEDEIENAITDTAYLFETGKEKGHDRGIDALYVDTSESPAIVHLFNFKYTDKFKATTKHFPSSEINNIISFMSDLMRQEDEFESTVNKPLFTKVKDVWNLFDGQPPNFVVHICTNSYEGFEPKEQERFERELSRYSLSKFSETKPEYHLMPDFVSRLTRKGKQTVNARIRAIDKNLFEKADGDIRALIVDIDAKDLLRIVVDHEKIRQDAHITDYSVLQQCKILEDAFEDNVRIYLKQRTKINQSIKATARSEDAHRLFYFNNGITITCSHFDYAKQLRSPVITLENLQVVNGSQTIHALFEAFCEEPDRFDGMDILCRIYETRNEKLSSNIAEYTNSQNPVTSRDIRSNDFVQQKLEQELRALDYYYERKKGAWSGKDKSKRIDAEKAGQVLLSFFNKMPAEAKDKKRLIFADRYNEVFSDEVTADAVLLASHLFDEIERRKLQRKEAILQDTAVYEDESYILHASYYLLFILSELADLRGIPKKYMYYQDIVAMYDDAVELVKLAVSSEKQRLETDKENYNHRTFFLGNRPKTWIYGLLNSVETLTTPAS